MRYLSYGLIISLSLFLVAPFAIAADNEKAVPPEEPKQAEQKVQEQQAVPADKAAQDESIKQLMQLYSELANLTGELHKKIAALNDRCDSFGTSLSTPTQMDQLLSSPQFQQQLHATVASAYETNSSSFSLTAELQRLSNKQQEIIAALTSLASNQLKMEERIDVVSIGTSAPVSTAAARGEQTNARKKASNVSVDERNGQQYIKLKVIENGQEVELILDPTYVDMNLNLEKGKPKSSQAQSAGGKDKKDDTGDASMMMENLARELNAISQNRQSNPSGENSVVSPVVQRGDTQQQQMPGEQSSVDNLYKAQKLFYEKKYNAALNAVQRSIDEQETALGYALEGSIYFTMGDTDLAISSWENALKLNPNMHDVKKVLFKYKR